ncbi:MAG: glycosyltransferase [Streptosporangiales bacterium]|nr:glycosyltransferase [Streptosporangiales bacterium]
MRIGLVCPYTWEVPGGVQTHVRDLAEALLDVGHRVSVITPAEDETELPLYAVAGGRAVPVRYNGSVARLAFGPRAVARVRRWLRDGRFDLVHVHEPIAPSLSLLACWAASAPVVGTFHTANAGSVLLAAAFPLLQTAVERISARIAVSEAARTTLARYLGPEAVLIPNGVVTSRYTGVDPLPGWPGAGGVLGFLGRTDEPRKGLPVLLDAFRVLAGQRPDLRLLVAGPGDPAVVHDAVPPGWRDRVVLLGEVTERDKARMLHSVDVFVAPNTGGESFGLVLAEAMAAGAPVLASDLPAFRSVLGPAHAGATFRTGDAEALAKAAAGLLDDPVRRKELAATAGDVVQRYDWGTVVADVLRVYETITPRRDVQAGGR